MFEGVTSENYFLPLLDPNFVCNSIIDAIITNQTGFYNFFNNFFFIFNKNSIFQKMLKLFIYGNFYLILK